MQKHLDLSEEKRKTVVQDMEHGMRDNTETNRTGRQHNDDNDDATIYDDDEDGNKKKKKKKTKKKKPTRENWRFRGKLLASIPVLASPTSTTVVAYLPVALVDRPCCDLHSSRLGKHHIAAKQFVASKAVKLGITQGFSDLL